MKQKNKSQESNRNENAYKSLIEGVYETMSEYYRLELSSKIKAGIKKAKERKSALRND